jgi:hypothetical protein
MRVVVAGAVAWVDRGCIRRELSALPIHAVVVHGDGPGPDALGGQVATELGLTGVPMAKSQQDYARYRRRAHKGLNERMLAGAPRCWCSTRRSARAGGRSTWWTWLATRASRCGRL